MNNIQEIFDTKQNKEVLIITGLSGAGKSTVLDVLEDLGFYCVDNLPVPLLSSFLNLAFQTQTNLFKVALGIDVRGGEFLKNFINEMNIIKEQQKGDIQFKIVFLNSSDDVLQKRFQTTRRNHPLVKDNLEKDLTLFGAIKLEREILAPLMDISDIKLETDNFSIHDLRRWAKNSFSDVQKQEMLVNLISFGFKFGVPTESNYVYDLRSLPNPYFVEELKKLDGRSENIQSYLFEKAEVIDYWERLKSFLYYSLQKSYQEGRFFVNVAIGCTGGKHRSVAFVERIKSDKVENVRFLVQHRDLGKE